MPDAGDPEVALPEPGIRDRVPRSANKQMRNRRPPPRDRSEGNDVDRLRTMTGLEAGIQDLEAATERNDEQSVAGACESIPVRGRPVAVRRARGPPELPEVPPARENERYGTLLGPVGGEIREVRIDTARSREVETVEEVAL